MGRRWMFVLWAVVMIIGLSFPESGQSASTPARKVNIALGGEPFSLDATTDSSGANGQTLENINEFLIKKETNGELTPGLASWKVSLDGKVIEFTLRKGVKFHSGDPLTTKDVLFTFERTKKVNRYMNTVNKNIDKIEVLDDYRIRFVFKTPDVTLIPKRFYVMISSKSYYDRVGEDKFTKAPVGTGPYKFVRYEIGQYLDLERFEDYWGKKPPVREARIYYVQEDTTRIAKLQAGEVDVIQAVPFNMVKMVESSPNLKTVKLATHHPSRSVMIGTRNPNKPWYDKRVRLAMAYAVDCESILKNVLFGIPNHWPWLAPDEVGYDPTVKTYPYDPKRAKQLLAEAGYPNGFEVTLYWTMTGKVPMSAETVQAIASYWEAVGIRTKLEGKEADAFNALRIAAKKPTTDYVGFVTGGMPGSPDPTYSGETHYACDGASSAYCNPEYDKILFEARATVDNNKRAELIKKMVKILREEVPSIPIFDNVAIFGLQKNIDFVPTQNLPQDLLLVKDITVK